MTRGRARFTIFTPRILHLYSAFVSFASCADYGIPIEIKVWDTGRSPLAHMVDITNGFGLKVLAEHNFLNENNIAFSPYGLMGILVALYEGVDGESSYQIQRGMQLPWNRNVMRIGFRDIHRTLKTYFVPEEGFLAGLALNNENVTFNESYKKILRFYGFDLDNDQKPTITPESNVTISVSTSTEQNPDITVADSTPTTMTVTESVSTMSTKEETTINADAETLDDLDPRGPPSTSGASNSKTTTAVTENTTFQSTTATQNTTTETSNEVAISSSTIEMTSLTSSSSSDLATTTTTAETISETTTTTTTAESISETTTTTTTAESISETTTKTTTAESISETTTTPTTAETPITTSPPSTMTTDLLTDSGSLSTREITSTSAADSTNQNIADSSTMTTMQTNPEDRITPTELNTETTEATTTSITMTTSTTDTEQTDSTTVSTLETLERRKRSLLNYGIFPKSPMIDDFLISRSFEIPPSVVNTDLNTKKMFLVNGLRNVQVSYMHYDTVLEHAYLPHLEASALRLPLDSDRYYLLVVLPSRGGTVELGRLLARMGRESDLSDIYAALRPRRVRAIVPSFTVKGHITLTTDLQKLGIRDVFEPRQQDFTPMTRGTGVYVRSIEQAVSVAIRKYQPDEQKKNRYVTNRNRVFFAATYPFLYFVMDSSIHVALMAGKMVDPLNTRIL